MSNLTNALIMVLCISAMLLLGGVVASDLTKEDKKFINCAGTMFNCTNGTYSLTTSDPLGKLPEVNSNPVNPTGITGEEGIFANIGSWLADVTGISFVYNIISAPSTFMSAILSGTDISENNKRAYVDIFATIWYTFCLFLIISWWKGQDS